MDVWISLIDFKQKLIHVKKNRNFPFIVFRNLFIIVTA